MRSKVLFLPFSDLLVKGSADFILHGVEFATIGTPRQRQSSHKTDQENGSASLHHHLANEKRGLL
jgi:hypothetical protein